MSALAVSWAEPEIDRDTDDALVAEAVSDDLRAEHAIRDLLTGVNDGVSAEALVRAAADRASLPVPAIQSALRALINVKAVVLSAGFRLRLG